MIIDSSALVAILLVEPEALRLTTAIAAAPGCKLPSSCFLEASMFMLGRNGENGLRDFDLYLARRGISIIPFSEKQARLAR